MSIKDILVHVDMSPAGETRVRFAAELAHQFGAYVTGVALEEAAACQEAFEAMLRTNDLQGEWHTAIGSVAPYVTQRARTADLVILGQRAPEHPTELNAPEDVILACGRPVLVVPYAGRLDPIGRRVLIAWNASREATRAVHDALPLMSSSTAATVLTVRLDPSDDVELDRDLIPHLERHGIEARAEVSEYPKAETSEVVLSRAADFGADLIVMGAYGHSRLREMVLGGMTRDVLRHMSVPALMSH